MKEKLITLRKKKATHEKLQLVRPVKDQMHPGATT